MADDQVLDVVRALGDACARHRPEIVAWVEALPAKERTALDAALKECATVPARKAAYAALQRLAEVDGTVAASWLGTEFNKIVDGKVEVAPVEEVGDAQAV